MLASIAAFIVINPLHAFAQGPQLNAVDTDTSHYPAVTITVEALTPDGSPISGLDQSAFSVYENGIKQTIDSSTVLENSPTPLNVMLTLDTSLSMADGGKIDQAKQAAMAFVSQMRPIDRAGLIQFDSQLTLLSPMTSDTATLLSQINRLSAQGNTRIYDALYLALKQAPSAEGSTAIVLMTDGKDTESAIELQGALSLIRQTGIRVYTIGIGSDIDQQVLMQIASESGGRFYSAPTPADIGNAFRLMSDQLRNRYQITYQSPATAPRGTKNSVQLTAQTPQGLASMQMTYVTPAILTPSNSGAQPMQQPEVKAPAVMSTRTAILVSAAIALGVLLVAGGLALLQVQRTRHSRLSFFLGNRSEDPESERESLIGESLVSMARTVIGAITHALPATQVQTLSRQISLAGNPYGWRVGQLVAAKFLLGLLGAGLGFLYLTRGGDAMRGVLMIAGLGFLGYRLPTFWVKRRIKLRQNAILRSLPDALDLLTICVEAGLGIDGAILEVVNRWDNALSDEFSIVLAEIKMGRSRQDALRGLSQRTGLQEVTAFTSAMIQADELGMGIARPLALQAAQLRIRRKQRAEKLAHEAGIKMVMAMGVFIMPALFMIILSPAVVQIQSMFGGH